MEKLTDLFTISEAVTILRHLAEYEKQSEPHKLTDNQLIALIKVLDLLNSLGAKDYAKV